MGIEFFIFLVLAIAFGIYLGNNPKVLFSLIGWVMASAFWLTLIGIVILSVLVGGYWFYGGGFKSFNNDNPWVSYLIVTIIFGIAAYSWVKEQRKKTKEQLVTDTKKSLKEFSLSVGIGVVIAIVGVIYLILIMFPFILWGTNPILAVVVGGFDLIIAYFTYRFYPRIKSLYNRFHN